MSIKTLVVAPYEGMREVFKQVAGVKDNFQIEIVVGNLEEGLTLVRERGEENFDLIISRGGTAELIQKNVSVPVVDIQVSGYDMLRVLKLVSNFPGKAAIVGFPNISQGAATICSLLDLELLNLTIHSGEEVKGVLQDLVHKGYELVIGDVVTVNVAKEVGLTGILITSGTEAVFDVLEKAEKTYKLFVGLKEELDIYKTVLQEAQQAIVIFDQYGHVIKKNNKANMLLESWDEGHLEELKAIFEDFGAAGTITSDNKLWNVEIKYFQVGEKSYAAACIQENHLSNHSISGVTVEKVHTVPSLTGQGDTIAALKKQIEIFSGESKSVYIQGELGTGKDLIAKLIHKQSNRSQLSFITIDCKQVMPDQWDHVLNYLMNSGATIGTVYLKNVDSLDHRAQVELLRIKDEIGLNKLICSSLRNVKDMVVTGGFLPELFSMIGNVSIHIPPLRERIDDIEPLVQMFISIMHSSQLTQVVGIRKEAIDVLKNYQWPGNIEELERIIEQLILQANGFYIEAEDVNTLISNNKELTVANSDNYLSGTLEEIEKRIILKVLEEEDMNQSKAAKRLGINRSTLWRKLK